MSNKLFIIIILIVIIIFFYFNLIYVDENKNNLDIEIKSKESENEINENDQDVLHSDDIDSMFNISEGNEEEDMNSKNIVYLDININNNRGRILISLNNKITPKTCKNFSVLCEKKAYVNSPFHRVIKDFMIQGGDFTNHDGTGGISIYGNKFNDENFTLKNDRGTISMANSGPNTNGSQFFISTKDNNFLDGKHVVFGKVIKGMDLVDYIENVETDENNKPLNEILIVDSGIM